MTLFTIETVEEAFVEYEKGQGVAEDLARAIFQSEFRYLLFNKEEDQK